MHTEGAVDVLIDQLDENDTELKAAVLPALFRLYHIDKPWDGTGWWGTRPDDRGPYYQPITWEASEKIKQAVERTLRTLPESYHKNLLAQMRRHRIAPSNFDLGVETDALAALYEQSVLEASVIPSIVEAAKDGTLEESERIKAFRLLERINAPEAFVAQLELVANWAQNADRRGALNAAGRDFIYSPQHATQVPKVLLEGRQASDEISAVAWGIALNLLESPVTPDDARTLIQKAIDAVPRQPGFYLALSRSGLTGFDHHVKEALQDDNPQLEAAAKRAQRAMKRLEERKAKSNSPSLASLSPEDATKALLEEKGDRRLGQRLFTRQACVGCHTVTMDQPQKGPYLGAAGGKFTREYLVQALIDPSAVVAQGFQTTLFEMEDGAVHLGFITGGQDEEIEIRDIAGLATTLQKSKIKKQTIQKTSLMPPGLMSALTVHESASLVDYLQSLK